MASIEERLTGGHPNSLGNTVAVVEDVLDRPQMFEELFNCYFSKDEVVRLRVSSAIKRIAKAKREIVIPYLDRLQTEIALIDQASTQWTLAQLFHILENDLTSAQMERAKEIVKNNVQNHNDWIVLNESMRVLEDWSKSDSALRTWLKPELKRLTKDSRKSVANRANKYLKGFD